MGVEVALLCEPLVAELAVVGLLAGMQAHVRDQVALLGESLFADLTGEWTVRLDMLLTESLVLEHQFTGGAVEPRVHPRGRGPLHSLGARAPLVPRLVIV